jgi:DivIVA domain-containing protein
MSTNDQDMLPPPPNAEQIRRREFATVRRGYDPEQVRTYLASIADQTELLERELNQVRLELTSAASRGQQAAPLAGSAPAPPAEDPYEALSKRFAGLIETADQEAVKILENAKSEARQALAEARSEADRIRVDAQAHAEEGRQEVADLLERATTEADRVLSTLAERRRSLTARLAEMRTKLISMAEDLAAPIDEAARDEAAGVHEDAEGETVSEEPAEIDAEVVIIDDKNPVAEAETSYKDETPADVESATAGEAGRSGRARKPGKGSEDSRYEDLWVTKEESVQIPELETLDLHREEPGE